MPIRLISHFATIAPVPRHHRRTARPDATQLIPRFCKPTSRKLNCRPEVPLEPVLRQRENPARSDDTDRIRCWTQELRRTCQPAGNRGLSQSSSKGLNPALRQCHSAAPRWPAAKGKFYKILSIRFRDVSIDAPNAVITGAAKARGAPTTRRVLVVSGLHRHLGIALLHQPGSLRAFRAAVVAAACVLRWRRARGDQDQCLWRTLPDMRTVTVLTEARNPRVRFRSHRKVTGNSYRSGGAGSSRRPFCVLNSSPASARLQIITDHINDLRLSP